MEGEGVNACFGEAVRVCGGMAQGSQGRRSLGERGGRVRIKKYLEMLTQGKCQCKA